MNNNRKRIFLSGLVAVGLALASLSGCEALNPQPEPTPEPGPLELFRPVVSATGVVRPAQSARLSVTTPGIIEEVLVKEDDAVTAGDVLLRLIGQENLEAGIAATKFELAAAEKALADLSDDLDLRQAQAYREVVQAEQDVRDAERTLANRQTAAPQVDIEQARANLALARDQLEQAIEDYEPYEDKPEDNTTRAVFLSRKAQAQKEYDAAARLYNNLTGTASELDIEEAKADLELAEARLAAARADYEIIIDGPDPEDVALAEERVANARAQQAAAMAALDDLLLVAPFNGTVSELYVQPSEYIAPGQTVLLLADLDHLRVETTDLNEIDVARIKVGDTAIVTFDALPEVELIGTVTRIASKADEGSGVNYPVIVELDELPADLRWGMTAFVDIEVE